jgi:hypothetical protein
VVGAAADDVGPSTLAISDTVGTTYTIPIRPSRTARAPKRNILLPMGSPPSSGANTVLVDPTASGLITRIPPPKRILPDRAIRRSGGNIRGCLVGSTLNSSSRRRPRSIRWIGRLGPVWPGSPVRRLQGGSAGHLTVTQPARCPLSVGVCMDVIHRLHAHEISSRLSCHVRFRHVAAICRGRSELYRPTWAWGVRSPHRGGRSSNSGFG